MTARIKRITAGLIAVLMVAALFAGIMPMRAVPVKAADGPVIRLHYHRPDGNYAGWDVWFWEYGKEGAAYAFEDVNGEKVATMQVTAGVTSVGFIVRTESWDKDVSEDQFIDIAELVTGSVDIYVESGVKGYTKEYGGDAAVGIKVKSAKYNMDGTVTVEMTAELEGDLVSQFSMKGKDGDIGITGISPDGSKIYTFTIDKELDVYGKGYYLTYDGNDYPITLPVVFSTDEFEAQFTYKGDDLGAVWSKTGTTFRVWAPTASEVSVNLYQSGTDGTDDLIRTVPMTADVNGTWVATVNEDLNGTYYTYAANVDGELREACDPYARTTGANGKRAMVIDLDSTDPEGWNNDMNPHAGEGINDAIIYEAHIRDLTVNSEANILNKGKYLGLTETGTKTLKGKATAVDHMVELGITHLHLLPVYDFGSVDETSAINRYNWGYDPVNYNVPEGSYSTDAYNGEVRVREFKQMVQSLHNRGISVVMDVVYNHVYSAADFCFNKLVPGYFSRMKDGVYSNGSGCGNDTASERSMVRKYIVDSVLYWADEYHIDGFRFDLVGLLDVDTVNEIVETVHKTHPDVIFYGEGWSLSTNPTKENVELATQINSKLTPGFAYFNDTIRDALKGSVFNTAAGFVSGAAGNETKIQRCFIGLDTWCKTPAQTINYASCHDNNTLFDRLRLSNSKDDEETIIKMNNLAAAIYMTAEGVPFMSAGEEMLRTKTNKDGTYNSNSYNAGDTVNSIKWATLEEQKYADVYDYYRGLIAFRKAHPSLRLDNAADIEANVSTIAELNDQVVGFNVKGGQAGETVEEMYLFFNAKTEPVEYTLPDGSWDVYINGTKAGNEILGSVSGKITIEPVSALVVAKTIPGAAVTDTPAQDKSGTQTDAQVTGTDGTQTADGTTKSNTGTHIVIGVIGLAAVAAVIALARRNRKK